MNTGVLVGRVGSPVDHEMVGNGKTDRAKISLATNRPQKVKGTDEFETATDWHKLVCWGRIARYAHAHVNTGDLIAVRYTLRPQSWTDASGKKCYRTDIYVEQLRSLYSSQTHKKDDRNSGQDPPKSYDEIW